jgi:N-acetylglutamate synthase/N-acetylornithine aminotransferase
LLNPAIGIVLALPLLCNPLAESRSPIGYSGVEFDPSKVSLRLCSGKGKSVELVRSGEGKSVELVRSGEALPLSERDTNRAAAIMQESEPAMHLDLGLGRQSATVWASDLSYGYVKINAEYTT